MRSQLLTPTLLLPLVAHAQSESVASIGRFVFETGGEILDMIEDYVTWGKLNDAKSNAILPMPGTSGNRHSYGGRIGLGKTFDTDKYFVIGADPIGGGTPSSPKDGLGVAFPKYGIRYMASRNFDASVPFGGDMTKALGQIKARTLLLPSMTDRTIPGYLTRELYRGIRSLATNAEIPSIRGYSASGAPPGTAEYAYISDKTRGFLTDMGK
jgi:homoserine acetyltransferase